MTTTPVRKTPSPMKRSQSLPRTPRSGQKVKNKPMSIYDMWGSYEVARGIRCNQLCEDGNLIARGADEPHITTIWSTFQQGRSINPKGNCLGWREGDDYKWWSFDDVHRKACHLAAALSGTGLKRQDCVGIYSATKPLWLVTSLACVARSLVIVPLYDTLGAESCKYIINQTEITMLFVDVSAAALRVLSKIQSTPSLRTLVIFEHPDEKVIETAKKENVTLITIDDFIAQGFNNHSGTGELLDLPLPDDNYIIMYTSGTTGDPKGVVITQKGFVSNMIGIDHFFRYNMGEGLRFSEADVGLGFLPLAHAYGLLVVNWFMYRGASTGFFSGNVLKLMEDAEVLKPTFFPLVPRLMNRIYARITGELAKNNFKSKVFWYAYRRKKEAMIRGVISRDSVWDRLVFNKIQNLIGGRVWFCSVGSAPVSSEVLEFWRVVFGCLILEGYGQTECAACASCAMGPLGGNVGHPLPCNYIKLADVPECGYYVGEGRGEVCVKGINVMTGYYKQPEKTAEALDADGWLHTGDIGEFLPDGSLKIVDRKKNIFKLAQGEYIAPEKIENVYLMCPEILQVFVDGNSVESYTVAVAVPEPSMAKLYATEQGVDIKSLHLNVAYKKFVLTALNQIGKENRLNSLEQVKSIYLTPEPFSVENGLLTPTMKNKRPELRKIFRDQIEALYKAGPMIGGESAGK